MWMALVLSGAVATEPQPSPTPLKTITNVHSSAFCSALRDNVGTAVKALIQNNVAVGDAKSLFLDMAHDKVFSAARNAKIDMEMDQLGPIIVRVSRNLADAQSELDGLSKWTFPPGSEDARRVDEMKTELRAIIDHQNSALNILSGTFYSYNGNELLHHQDKPLDGDDPKEQTPVILPPVEATPEPSASSAPASGRGSELASDPANPKSQDLGLLGYTRYAGLFNDLTTYQVQELPLESQAAKSILTSARKCNGGA